MVWGRGWRGVGVGSARGWRGVGAGRCGPGAGSSRRCGVGVTRAVTMVWVRSGFVVGSLWGRRGAGANSVRVVAGSVSVGPVSVGSARVLRECDVGRSELGVKALRGRCGVGEAAPV